MSTIGCEFVLNAGTPEASADFRKKIFPRILLSAITAFSANALILRTTLANEAVPQEVERSSQLPACLPLITTDATGNLVNYGLPFECDEKDAFSTKDQEDNPNMNINPGDNFANTAPAYLPTLGAA